NHGDNSGPSIGPDILDSTLQFVPNWNPITSPDTTPMPKATPKIGRSAYRRHQSDPCVPAGAGHRGAARPAFPAGRIASYPSDALRAALASHVALHRGSGGGLAPAGRAYRGAIE